MITFKRIINSLRYRSTHAYMRACHLLGLSAKWNAGLRRKTFQKMFHGNDWGSSESVSGPGSTLAATQSIRSSLPELLKRLEVKTLLDAPCGDFNWMPHVLRDLDMDYIGGDIVPELIERNSARFGGERVKFRVLDLATDELPTCDLLFCRDCLFHLPLNDVRAVLRNIARSSIPYLLTTNHPECAVNKEIIPGEFRDLNLEKPPFNLSRPQLELNDDVGRSPKVIGLWTVKDLGVK